MKTNSLYLHIPFCEQICAYCDFCKVFYNEHQADDYLAVLKHELQALNITEPLKTIYIGGGTPSSLNDEQLEWLMDIIKPYISSETKEVSIEVNPESIDYYKLDILKRGGVSRLSIGVETFNDILLKKINRQHTTIQLPIEHISYYSIILEDHTVLKNLNYQPLDEEVESKITQLIEESLEQIGFHKYEISNFAKTGYESLHNLAYWQYDNYYGIGVGASGKIDDCLIEHNRNLNAYLRRQNTITKMINSKEETMFNHLMMSLRLVKGLDLKEFEKRYGLRAVDVYQTAIDKHLKMKTLVIENDYLHATSESIKLLNEILIDFL